MMIFFSFFSSVLFYFLELGIPSSWDCAVDDGDAPLGYCPCCGESSNMGAVHSCRICWCMWLQQLRINLHDTFDIVHPAV